MSINTILVCGSFVVLGLIIGYAIWREFRLDRIAREEADLWADLTRPRGEMGKRWSRRDDV